MNKLCIGILFATAIAWAGIGVVNFPYGEKSGGPDACRAIQLNVQGVSPSSGTVSIGEIAAKWETETYAPWIVETYGYEYEWDGEKWVLEDSQDYISFGDGEWTFAVGGSTITTNAPADFLGPVVVDMAGVNKNLTRESADPIIVPHATTNALFTVTAAGGNATNNLPDKTFLRFAGHDFVRYGTATGGVVNLFVED